MISVIVPLYNVEKYIRDCLDSLENQFFKDFEVIIVNDGSTDRSLKIVEDYSKNTSLAIKIVSQENGGVSRARNTGVSCAEGDFICFIDSDDIISPDYLENMIYMINNDNCEMAICNQIHVQENFDEYKVDVMKNRVYDSMTTLDALRKFLYREISPGVGSFLIKKEIIKSNELKFQESYRYSEDIEFIYKAISNCEKIAYTSEVYYYYRLRESSAMSRVDNKRLDGYKLMISLEEYFEINNIAFAEEYREFGVARWLWATLWQVAYGSDSYLDFKINIENYDTKLYINKLINFPQKKVKWSSYLYKYLPFVYYKLINKYAKLKVKRTLS